MKNDSTVTNIFNLEGRRYPHFKITAEPFPRVLATRAIEQDGAEYFGAFLPKTVARILIDLINRSFRLRTCDIEIDGSFAMPCTQYFRHRCVAPCVEKLCSRMEYLERVELVRLFLSNERRNFRTVIKALIAARSEQLDFENAAFFRDILERVERFWKQPRMSGWLDDAVDNYEIEETPVGFTVYLVTIRHRAVLGRKVFDVPREEAESPDEALAQILDGFYVTHLPKEIRIPVDFFGRKQLAHKLSDRFGRQAILRIVRGRTITAMRGALLSHDEHEIDRARPRADATRITRELRNLFRLPSLPHRIEAFDVAHISGTGFVAASAVWEKGRYHYADYQFIISTEKSELDALADAVARSILDKKRKKPDLVVLDGGKNQLNKVLKRLATDQVIVNLIAAVKPREKHSSIASFLTTNSDSIPFNVDSPAQAMLQLLRDEAHDLANRTHRDYREMMPFYEAAGHDKPLVVPLRFHAENGGAEDLIPIEAR